MIPGEKQLPPRFEAEELPLFPEDMEEDEAPEVKVEPEPRDPEVVMAELSEEWLKAMKGEPGGYHIEYTKWVYGPTDVQRGRIKISKHVKIDRAILRELLIIRGILQEFEEDEG